MQCTISTTIIGTMYGMCMLIISFSYHCMSISKHTMFDHRSVHCGTSNTCHSTFDKLSTDTCHVVNWLLCYTLHLLFLLYLLSTYYTFIILTIFTILTILTVYICITVLCVYLFMRIDSNMNTIPYEYRQ